MVNRYCVRVCMWSTSSQQALCESACGQQVECACGQQALLECARGSTGIVLECACDQQELC